MSPTVKTMLELNIDGASLQKEGAFFTGKMFKCIQSGACAACNLHLIVIT